MDKAYEFCEQASNVPVNECMEKLVYLPEVAREAGVEVTFSDKPHVDNLPRLFYLRQGQIENFLKIADKFNSHGWIYTPLDRGRCRYYKSCANISSKYGTEEIEKKFWRPCCFLGGRMRYTKSSSVWNPQSNKRACTTKYQSIWFRQWRLCFFPST